MDASKKSNNPNIYITKNNINGKIYIGQSYYCDPHYYGSGIFLKKAIKKYGKENFTKEILEFCSLEEIDEKEKFYINKFNSRNSKKGYNFLPGGKGICLSGKYNHLSKKIYVYNFTGELMEEFRGIRYYARELNINTRAISRTLSKERFHYKNKIFSKKALSKQDVLKMVKEYDSLKFNRRSFQKLFALSEEGEEFIFYNTEMFAKEHGLSGREIRYCLDKIKHTHKKWRFRKDGGSYPTEKSIAENRSKKLCGKLISAKNGNEEILFYNTEFFAKEHNLKGRRIRDCLYNNLKYNEWSFKYAREEENKFKIKRESD